MNHNIVKHELEKIDLDSIRLNLESTKINLKKNKD